MSGESGTPAALPSPVAAALLLCSGVAALVYETLWVKALTLVVGVDVVAVTIVVAAFFGGLACGSAFFGLRADRGTRPLRLYARLEAGTALLGATTTLALMHLAPLHVRAVQTIGPLAWLLPLALVAAPAFLMGGTLPVMLRASAAGVGRIGAVSGALNAANTAGGVLGAVLGPLVLVPSVGVQGAGLVAAGVNMILALVAVDLAGLGVAESPAPAGPTPERLAPLLYALAGGVALGYEIVWTLAVIPFIGTRAFAFALVLATYLAGLVGGSALWALVADRVGRPWRAFGLLEMAAGVATLATFAALGPWLPAVQQSVTTAIVARTDLVGLAMAARMLVATGVVLLVPTLLLGAAFPAVARLAAAPGRVARDVGMVAALNTLGGVGGTVLTTFVLLPALGLRGTVGTLAAAAVVIGGVAVVHGAARQGRAAVGVAAVAALVVAAAASVPRDHLARLVADASSGTLLRYEESPGGSVAVVREPFLRTTFQRLYIHGVSNSNDGLMSRRYMRLQALLPLLVHDGPARRALVIGLGTGITCGALSRDPTLETRTCVELLPAVVRAVGAFEGNYDVAHDAATTIRVADGRHELLLRDQQYDVITLEPPPPLAAGVVNLYSRDFYALAARRLAPHGLMAQWLPLATQNDEDTRALVRSFLDVFPAATLWTTELHETLLLGGQEELRLDPATIAARMAQPDVTASLAEVGVADPVALLSTFVTDRAGLEAYAADAPAVTDDRPRIEHASWIRSGEFARVLTRVLEQRCDPPLVGGDDDTVRALVAARRDTLLAFYQAAVYWYGGQADQVEPLLTAALGAEPANPYFRWFLALP